MIDRRVMWSVKTGSMNISKENRCVVVDLKIKKKNEQKKIKQKINEEGKEDSWMIRVRTYNLCHLIFVSLNNNL